jgi:site-specific DNA-methyltransferase (adenine-specific)
MEKQFKLMLGDNMESLKKLPDNSIDSVVSDPPYGLSFMGKKWDYDVPSVELWKEVYRVLKPGGHLLSFGGTRTYHRMVVNIEDAGFEIRDQIMWLYGSGFPKSHNIGKAVDKLNGVEREVVGEKTGGAYSSENNIGINRASLLGEGDGRKTAPTRGEDFGKITKGTSPYEGWGTALKPANEPICVARKPLSEKSVAENVLKWGTGGINIDGCRVGSDMIPSPQHNTKDFVSVRTAGDYNNTYNGEIKNNEGRFPANIILECICDEVIKGEKGEVKKSNGRVRENHQYNSVGNMGSYDGEGTIDNYNDKGDIHTNPNCPCYLLDEQSGISKSSKGKQRSVKNIGSFGGGLTNDNNEYNDKGGASRFFYVAKVSKSERNMGLDGFEDKEEKTHSGFNSRDENGNKLRNDGSIIPPLVAKNTHPTLKPVQLMSYLCRLVTPANGIVLDPFMGSGSTGIAAQLEGFRFIGMELDLEYFKIASARIENYEMYRKFLKEKKK